jgi:hypothetical protein
MQSESTGTSVLINSNRSIDRNVSQSSDYKQSSPIDASRNDDATACPNPRSAQHDTTRIEMELPIYMKATRRQQHGASEAVLAHRHLGHAIEGSLEQRRVIRTRRLDEKYGPNPRNGLASLVPCIGEIDADRAFERHSTLRRLRRCIMWGKREQEKHPERGDTHRQLARWLTKQQHMD